MPSNQLPVPTEAQEGEQLVAYLRLKGFKFTHIGNETGSSPEARRRAIRLKRQGTSPGFPDYFILVDGQAITIELKRQRGSRTSPEQLEWIAALNDAGVPAKVCKGFLDAKDFVEAWEQPGRPAQGEGLIF